MPDTKDPPGVIISETWARTVDDIVISEEDEDEEEEEWDGMCDKCKYTKREREKKLSQREALPMLLRTTEHPADYVEWQT